MLICPQGRIKSSYGDTRVFRRPDYGDDIVKLPRAFVERLTAVRYYVT